MKSAMRFCMHVLVGALVLLAAQRCPVVAAGSGALHFAIRPGSEAGGLNVESSLCPGDIFDFRTCEGVVVGSKDFGLFQVRLPATPGDGNKSWQQDGGVWSYSWPYAQGVTVHVEVEPDGDSLKLKYTLQNTGPDALDNVQLHTCIPTTEAPGFFPSRTNHNAQTNWSELYQRLHVWSGEQTFTFAETRLAAREAHLSLMQKGAAPIRWGWWVNGPETFDPPLIALTSRDGRKTIALAFERAVWASANVGDDRACFHLFPWFGRIEPGQRVTVHGRLYVLEGAAAGALRRFRRDFPSPATGFSVRPASDRLVITHGDQPVADYVFRDEKILRPCFANLHTLDGIPVTRHHPPRPGQDATDHDTMHPGVWLAFGDINGQDFWRNKGRMEHVRFLEPPKSSNGRLAFATECRLLATNGAPVCSLTNRFTLAQLTNAWLLVWEATFHADAGDITFGDQEEMGFGARVATAITEKNGGAITSSAGLKSAKNTWGQPADWCDYSGVVNGQELGITLMADPTNFRPSWWHNRDYGLMVANPFGRDAMKQGSKSAVPVKRGETFRLRFGAVIRSSPLAAEATTTAAAGWRAFLNQPRD